MRSREKKNGRAGEAIDDNMAPAHCMLDTEGYTRSEYEILYLFFYTATIVTRTGINVTFILTLSV